MARPEDYIREAMQNGTAARTSIAGIALARMQRDGGPGMRPGLPTRRSAGQHFAAANHDRLTASWPSTPLTADQIILRNQRVLVARSREQSANNDYARKFLWMCRQNIVGPQGIALNAQVKKADGRLDSEVNNGLETDWWAWGAEGENCDVTGKRSFKRICDSVVNTAARDGEYFVRMVYGADAGPWRFALQTIDPQRCPVDLMEPARPDGTFIRHGIRFNRYGRALAYAFTTTTEGQADQHYSSGHDVQWVPAAEIIHGFIEEMEGQKRGLPWMATGLLRMRHLNGFEDAAIVNARLGASKIGIVQWQNGFGPELEEDEEVPEFTADPGEILTLPEGADFKEWNPQFPSGDTGPFVKHLLRGIAAGFGVPYNELAADLEGVNFSSIRQGTLDSREGWKDRQEWLVETLCARVFNAWLEYQLLAARLKSATGRPLQAAKVDKYKAVVWQPRRWDWIDPNADLKAAEGRKNNFLASASSIIRESGRDPSAVWVESARDMRSMVDAMVAEGFDKDKAQEVVLLSFGRQPDKPVPPKDPNAQAPAAA